MASLPDLKAKPKTTTKTEGSASMRLFRSLAFVWAIAVTALMSAVALIFPATDLVVSAYFYVPGRGFPASNETAMLALRSAGRILPGLAIAGVVLLAIYRLVRQAPLSFVSDRALAFLALCFSVAPGLIVNLLLKSHWGRPRPLATQDFGGPMPFTPAWSWWGGCPSNCSFASGEASTAMMLMAFVFVAPSRYRTLIASVVLVWTAIISLNRVAFGAHYISDVVIACGLTLACIAVFKVFVLDEPGPQS